MKAEIISNIENPRRLEELYRDNKTTFRRSFNLIYGEIKDRAGAQIWYERLNFEGNEISWGTTRELTVVITIALLAGVIAKIPEFASIDPERFYPRNLGFVVFPALATYFIWKQQLEAKKLLIILTAFLIPAVYVNTLPQDTKSDTLLLACIHLPLFLWSVLGFAYTGNKYSHYQKRLDFLRFNGDLVVMTTLIVISGGLLTGVTLGLFELIQLRIEDIYFKYFGVWGLSAAPIVATYLVQTNPQLVNKVSPVIARVFTPLVLVMLIVYISAVIYTGKDPYNDREFLLIFNLLLVGVMALILFSIVEISKNPGNRVGAFILFALAVVTVAVNGIALSAIVFRISEFGITPNRLAVLGGNVLILSNLLLVTFRLFKTITGQDGIERVENSIAFFLPIYSLWTIVVTFLFPVLFHYN